MSKETSKTIEVANGKTEKAKIEVLKHMEFEGDMKTNIISSIDMAEIVSQLFTPAFSDYYGCNVRINDGRANPIITNSMPIGSIYVDLYFKDQGEAADGTFKNIRLRGSNNSENGKMDLGARYFRVNGAINNSRAYEVTKETYEALEEFTVTGGRIRWNEHTQEITTPMTAYGKEEIVVCISGLSLNKIITKIYGAKTDEGRYEYIANPSTIIPSNSQEFIMQVSQLDLAAVRNLQRTLGIYAADAPRFHRATR